jgi:hypothetical protein
MAEKHQIVAISAAEENWQAFLQKLWDFVQNTQSGIIQFPQDGSFYGVKSGGSVVTDVSDLSAGFGSANDYIIIEPVNAYPGGDKWQIKFESLSPSSATAANMSVTVCWLGGWTQASEFGSNLTYTNPNAFEITFDDTMSWYFSCCNTDTYVSSSGTQTYTYVRILLRSGTFWYGVYCGGYIPTEPDSDTKPVIFLGNRVRVVGDGWGTAAAGSTNGNRIPADFTHSVLGGNNQAGVNYYGTLTAQGYTTDRSGNWVNRPCVVSDNVTQSTLGAFGRFTMLVGDTARTDGAADSNNEYLVVDDFMLRWKPSA